MIDDIISMMKDTDNVTYYGTADTILSIMANVMLVMLYLYPVPTFLRMFREDSPEEFHLYPYMITFVNCCQWVMYARFVIQRPRPVAPFYGLCLELSNTIGFILSQIYLGLFFALNERNRKEINKRYAKFCLMLVVPLMISIAVIPLIAGPYRLTGPLCVVFGISMYASPLSISRYVYKTKSIMYLPFWLCMAHFLNGLVWIIHTFVSPVFDLHIAITNGVGMLLGLFQLLKYYKFQNPQNSSKIHPQIEVI